MSINRKTLRPMSMMLNLALGGKKNQTFSARNYELKRAGQPNLVLVIDFIAYYMFREKDHCAVAWTYWVTSNNYLEKEI